MSLLLSETLLLIGLLVIAPRSVMFSLAGFFYGLWFYSTQIDHSQDYAYFLTAAFFCIWVIFMFELYLGVKHKRVA